MPLLQLQLILQENMKSGMQWCMPKKGEDWPTVTEMVQDNHRLLVFTSVASKEAEEGVAYQWKYMVENESGDPGVVQGSCPSRKESKPLNSKAASLFLMNYFPTYPVQADACKEHSTPLAEMVGTCFKAAGNVMPNFLAVNFYMVEVEALVIQSPILTTVTSQAKKLEVSVLVLDQKKPSPLFSW